MSRVEYYIQELRRLEDWEPYLLTESGLPGPRGNIELAQAVAEEGDEALFERLLSYDPVRAPTNSPEEFLAFCGVLGQGKLLAAGKREVLRKLRFYAEDPRWRSREAVAMALQRFGDTNIDELLDEMDKWVEGNMWVQRAVAAALCEPRLLLQQKHAERVLGILDRITASLENSENRKNGGFRVLRQALGYCWSVATVALPVKGKKMMERWFVSQDRDVRWIMRENLKKSRLARMDANWAGYWRDNLQVSNRITNY
jgi:hypothetical protein